MSANMYRRGTRWVLSTPLLLFLLLMAAFPLAYGVYVSFQNRTLLTGAVGSLTLENYSKILGDDKFWDSVLFTALYTIVTVGCQLVFGLALALLFQGRLVGRRLLYTGLILPIFVAPALMAVLWRLGLNSDIGFVAGMADLFGIELTPYAGNWTLVTVAAADILQWTPLVFLICYAGLQSVDPSLTEAAQIDGANYWRLQRSVVLPQMRPMLAVAAFLRVIDGAKTFDVIYVLTGGGPGSKTTTTSIYIYKTAFSDGNFGSAAAASVVFLALMLALVPVVVRQVLKH